MFDLFNEMLESYGFIKHEGVIVDATFVEAKIQRNTPEENKQIKEGKIPENWKSDDPKMKNKLRQKDIFSNWTRKGNQRYFGAKNNIKTDQGSKIILQFTVTQASTNDSQELEKLVNKDDKILYADAGYIGKEKYLPKEVQIKICKRATRGHPLTEEQKRYNNKLSKIRCRVEHVFAFMTNSMNGITVNSRAKHRIVFNIGLTNLIYNLFRYEYLRRTQTKCSTC